MIDAAGTQIHRERSTTGASLASTAIEILTAVVEVAAEVAISSTAKYPPPRSRVGDVRKLIEYVVVASNPRWESSIVDWRAMSAELEIAARCKCGALALVRVDEREVIHSARASEAMLAAIDRLACYHVEREAAP